MDELRKYKFADFSESRYIASEFIMKHIEISQGFYQQVSSQYQQQFPDCESIEFADQSQRWFSSQRDQARQRAAKAAEDRPNQSRQEAPQGHQTFHPSPPRKMQKSTRYEKKPPVSYNAKQRQAEARNLIVNMVKVSPQ